MPEEKLDRRSGLSYSFPASLHDKIQEIADARWGENRSMAAEKLIIKGLEAERNELGGQASLHE